MLLQKTGSRLKQFIAHRRRNSFENSGDVVEEERFTDRNISTNTPRRLSWLSQSPSAEFATLRRASSSATTRSRPLPPTTSTAYSSSSSLCSCDCESDPSPVEYSLSSPEPRPRSSEILYLPPLSSTKTRGNAKTWRLIFSEPLSPSPASSSSDADTKTSSFANARVSTFDLLEALSIDPIDEDTTPTQSVRSLEISDMEDISGDIDQLVRETDRAFQAVGNALEDAKAATQGRWESSLAKRPVTIPRVLLKNNSRFPILPLSKSPLSRSVSVTKSKRKKPVQKRRNILGRALRAAPPPPANTPTRWTLTDVTTNVVDVFSGKMFRTEVDEMLTPSRIQQIKEARGVESDRKVSAESSRTTATDGSTPTEPFHLESLSSRIDAAQVHSSPFPSPVLPPPATPNPTRDLHGKNGAVKFTNASTPPRDNSSMVINDLTFPSPPRPTRSRSNSRVALVLPAIPEVSPLTLLPNRAPRPTSKLPQVRLQQVQNHILLPSTPFSLTSPSFRHGPIRVERILKYPHDLSPEPEEDPLDWTAFQMAIQGTMNDSRSADDADDEWETDEAELDAIMNWWEGFGFQGFGRLAQNAPARTRVKNERKRRIWRVDTAEKIVAEQEMEFNRNDGSESTHIGDGDFGPAMDGLELDTSATKIEDVEKPQEGSGSLPSSPMVDLDPHYNRRNDEVPIPMGFNLGHDLGDFLNWETAYGLYL
jgi:hypothetical protein